MPVAVGGYRWNKTAARYVDARGRFVSIDNVRRALDTALEANRRRISSLSTALQSGNISLEQWRSQMRQAIKDAHLYSAAAARGGWAQMTSRDLGRVGQRVRYNYGRLERFAGQIARGEIPLDGRYVVRAGLYAGNARATYHRVEVETHIEAGYDEEINKLRPADHCGECVSLTRRGWVPIGTTKPIGERECLGNCQCGMEYRRSGENRQARESDEEIAALLKQWGMTDEVNAAVASLETSANTIPRQEKKPAPPRRRKAPPVAAPVSAPTNRLTNEEAATLFAKNETAIRGEAATLENEWRSLQDYERGAVWGVNGEILVNKRGTQRRVSFTAAESAKMDGFALFTHNHPSGSTFSRNDIFLAEQHSGLVIRAVGVHPNGKAVEYELRINHASSFRFDSAFKAQLKRLFAPTRAVAAVNAKLGNRPYTEREYMEAYAELMHEQLDAILNATDRYTYTRTFK